MHINSPDNVISQMLLFYITFVILMKISLRPKRVTSCHAVRVERYKMNAEQLGLFDEKYLSSDLLTFWTQFGTLLRSTLKLDKTHIVWLLESYFLWRVCICFPFSPVDVWDEKETSFVIVLLYICSLHRRWGVHHVISPNQKN